jgi:pimeloyl-ACP methyl ester carboxylesterase
MSNIVLLHGALGTGEDLIPLQKALSRRGHNVFVLTFSGHGKMDFSSSFGIKQFGVELRSFIYEKAIHQPFVFGYSMGGFVSLHLAATEPGLISGIVTLGTKFNWTPEVIAREAGNCDEKFLQEKSPPFLLQLIAKHKSHSELLIACGKMIAGFATEPVVTVRELQKLSIPVLLMCGNEDKMVSVSETRETSSVIPGASAAVLPFTRHQLESAPAEIIAEIMNSFMARKITAK